MKRADVWSAIAVSTALFLAVIIATVSGVDLSWLREAATTLKRDGADAHIATTGEFQDILIRNGAVALFLFSGVITAGISTVIALTLVAFSIGATMSAVGHAGGWARLVSDVVLYAPLEFASFCVCGAAGLLPLATSIFATSSHRESTVRSQGLRLPRYVAAFPDALILGAVGVAGVIVAACVEAIVISSRL